MTQTIDRQGASWKLLLAKMFTIALPIALQNLVSTALQLIDTVMVGQLDEVAISAVTAAGQPYFIFSISIFGVASGTAVLCSQYWGKGDYDSVANITGLAWKLVTVYALIVTVLMELFPLQVCAVFSSDQAVIESAAEYLKVVSWSYVFSGFTITTTSLLRVAGKAVYCLIFSTVAILTNTFFNYCMIFGKFGFAEEGVVGAAKATLISRVLEAVLILILFVWINSRKFRFGFKTLFHSQKFLVSQFWRYSSPVILNETAWSLGVSLQVACLGQISAVAMAAYSMTSTIERLGLVFTMGIANAAAIIIGTEVGAGRHGAARFYTGRLLASSVVMGLVFTGILIAVFPAATSLFNITPETNKLALHFFTIMCISSAVRNFNCPAVVGVLRGGGDTKTAAKLDLCTLWFVSLPIVALTALLLKLPAETVFYFFYADELTKFLLVLRRIRSGKWIKNLTLEKESGKA
ncbi:MAG: MATE family efflux transporter [Clostridia bacterium]|nr:MATE family efflux transporter [Clostridia bacterium]